MRWDWGEFSALQALTWADPRALKGGGSRLLLFDSLWWPPRRKWRCLALWGPEVCRVAVVGECWGQGPGGRPVLKHLLEVSAEPNQEAMAEAVAGVDLLCP